MPQLSPAYSCGLARELEFPVPRALFPEALADFSPVLVKTLCLAFEVLPPVAGLFFH